MEESENLVSNFEAIYRVSEILLRVLALLFVVAAVILVIDGLRPQRIVDRARRLRGVDLLAGVVDEALYFRFLKKQRMGLAAIVVLIGVGVVVEGFSTMARLEETSREGMEALLEMKANALWLEQQRQAPQGGPKLEELQKQLVMVEEALDREDPDWEKMVQALQDDLKEYLDGSESQRETLRELGDTLREWEQLRGNTGEEP